MARRKKTSRILIKGQQREASMRSISSQLDLGNGFTLVMYSNRLQDLQALVSHYNTTLSLLDKLSDDIAIAERDVRELSEKMLMGVGVKYGKSSQEYAMAGGVPKNKRRRSTQQQVSSSVAISEAQEVVVGSMNGSGSESTNGKTSIA